MKVVIFGNQMQSARGQLSLCLLLERAIFSVSRPFFSQGLHVQSAYEEESLIKCCSLSERDRLKTTVRIIMKTATNGPAMLPLPGKGTGELLRNLTNCKGVTCNGLTSYPRGVELRAAPCYRNRDKLRQLRVRRL